MRTRQTYVTRASACFVPSASSCTRSSRPCASAWRSQMPADTSSAATLAEQAKRLHVAETLLYVSRTVSAMETLDEVLAALIEMTVRETGSDRGTLFLNDPRSEEHTSELQSRQYLVCRLLLEKKKSWSPQPPWMRSPSWRAVPGDRSRTTSTA